jgi:hypothetical protein
MRTAICNVLRSLRLHFGGDPQAVYYFPLFIIPCPFTEISPCSMNATPAIVPLTYATHYTEDNLEHNFGHGEEHAAAC